MAQGIDIALLGDKALARKFRKLVPALQRKVLRKAMRRAIKPVLAAAKSKVPVDTGALRDSLQVKAVKPRRGTFGVQVVTAGTGGDDDTFYGAYVELGTKHQPARPYLRPALQEQAPQAKQTLRRVVGTGLAAEAKKE